VETIAQSPVAAAAFHADDAEQVAGYRTLSALAIVSLLFGFASPLCLAWPLLMAIPLVGAVISVFASRRIDASQGALAGRWAAVAGLVLCVVSGTAAVSRDLVIRTVRTRQAEAFGREWIELLVQGDAQQAFQLSVAANRRQPTVPEPGMPAPTKTPQELFLEEPIVSQLAAAGDDAAIEVGETSAYEPQPRRQFIIQKTFVIKPHNSAGITHGEPFEVQLTLQRSQLAGERQPRWLVMSHEVVESEDVQRDAEDAGHDH
jgi:hypothetical protein